MPVSQGVTEAHLVRVGFNVLASFSATTGFAYFPSGAKGRQRLTPGFHVGLKARSGPCTARLNPKPGWFAPIPRKDDFAQEAAGTGRRVERGRHPRSRCANAAPDFEIVRNRRTPVRAFRRVEPAHAMDVQADRRRLKASDWPAPPGVVDAKQARGLQRRAISSFNWLRFRHASLDAFSTLDAAVHGGR
jgi:hypothetical protein